MAPFKLIRTHTCHHRRSAEEKQSIPLSPADLYPVNRSCYMCWMQLIPYKLDEQQLVYALQQVLHAYPMLAGRAHVGDASGHVSLSNEGMQVGIASWEGGRAADFPGAFEMASTDLALPGFAEVPPYLETMDLDAMWQGQEPTFRLKLTHLGDGSSILASSLPHGIADGSRHAMLLADLATAYRGEQVPPKFHDRAAVYPAVYAALRQQAGGSSQAQPSSHEQPALAEQPVVAESQGATPAVEITAREVWRPPTQTTDPKGFAIHLLHIPEAQLEQIQAAANSWTPARQRISKTDIAGALYWLLRCRLDGKPLPGTSLEAPRLYTTVDLSFNGLPPGITPAGYFGNAVGGISVTAPLLDKGTEHTGTVVLSNAAAAIRQQLASYRSDAANALDEMQKRAQVSSKRDFVESQQAAAAAGTLVDIGYRVPSWRNFDLSRLNFGQGPPCLMLGCLQPVMCPFSVILNGKHNDGVILPMVLSGDIAQQKQIIQDNTHELLTRCKMANGRSPMNA